MASTTTQWVDSDREHGSLSAMNGAGKDVACGDLEVGFSAFAAIPIVAIRQHVPGPRISVVIPEIIQAPSFTARGP